MQQRWSSFLYDKTNPSSLGLYPLHFSRKGFLLIFWGVFVSSFLFVPMDNGICLLILVSVFAPVCFVIVRTWYISCTDVVCEFRFDKLVRYDALVSSVDGVYSVFCFFAFLFFCLALFFTYRFCYVRFLSSSRHVCVIAALIFFASCVFVFRSFLCACVSFCRRLTRDDRKRPK